MSETITQKRRKEKEEANLTPFIKTTGDKNLSFLLALILFSYFSNLPNKAILQRTNHLIYSTQITSEPLYITITNYMTSIPPSFTTRELVSSRVSRDLAFLFLVLPASFNNSASLRFSSSTSGFAVPSFSSLMPTTYSRISMASSSLQRFLRKSRDN